MMNLENIEESLEKKKRKTVQTKVETKQSGKVLFYAEENGVLDRDILLDKQLHKSTIEDIKKIMLSIKNINEDDPTTCEKQMEIDELKINGVLKFLTLKKLNRIGHFRCKKAREITQDAKLRIDQHHLKLQNLLYEVMHLQKEISKCLQYKSTDEEISLISVEEFFKNTSSNEFPNVDLAIKDDHQLRLARLDWELNQRQRLSAELSETKEQKNLIMSEIKTKKQYLDSLLPKLKEILQVTKPAQEHLNIPLTDMLEEQKIATNLPSPLYYLYLQAISYKKACDQSLSVSIEGDIELAQTFDTSILMMDDDSDSEDEPEKRKKKHRRITVDKKLLRKQEQILKRHPLSVSIKISLEDSSSIILKFHYLINLEFTTVFSQIIPNQLVSLESQTARNLFNEETFLMNLYMNDDNGFNTPNPANNFILKKLGLTDLKKHLQEIGTPLKWVQKLCGLEFMADNCNTTNNSQDSTVIKKFLMKDSLIEDAVKLLKKRLTDRLSLYKQLLSLDSGILTHSLELSQYFPKKIASQLIEWKPSNYEEFMKYRDAENIKDCLLANDKDFFFTGMIERKQQINTKNNDTKDSSFSTQMKFFVIIGHDYPASPPIFSLTMNLSGEKTALDDEAIREMEMAINLKFLNSNDWMHDYLLINQVRLLCVCFDIYLETEHSGHFCGEKMFLRLIKGPSRLRPYKYHNTLGFFCQL